MDFHGRHRMKAGPAPPLPDGSQGDCKGSNQATGRGCEERFSAMASGWQNSHAMQTCSDGPDRCDRRRDVRCHASRASGHAPGNQECVFRGPDSSDRLITQNPARPGCQYVPGRHEHGPDLWFTPLYASGRRPQPGCSSGSRLQPGPAAGDAAPCADIKPHTVQACSHKFEPYPGDMLQISARQCDRYRTVPCRSTTVPHPVQPQNES